MSLKRFERLLVGAQDGPAPLSVVEEGVHGLLKHPFLVPDDDLRRAELDEPLEPVVPIDHPSVKVVQIGGGEPSAVEGDEGSQIGRDDRNDLQDHPLRLIPRFKE